MTYQKIAPMDGILSEFLFMLLFQRCLKQLENFYKRRHLIRNDLMFAIQIRVNQKNRLHLVAGGRLCTMVSQRLLCVPGQRTIVSPLRHAIAVVSRRHFFQKKTPPTCVDILKRNDTSFICSAVFDPTGRFIATCGHSSNIVKVWLRSPNSMATCVANISVHRQDVYSVAFHPRQPLLLVTCSLDKTVKLLRLSPNGTTATCIWTLDESKKGHSKGVIYIAFHPTDDVIVTCSIDRTAKVWCMSADGTSASCFATLEGHMGCVTSAAFNPNDSSMLATTSIDRTAKLWRMLKEGTATCIATLNGHSLEVYSIAFNPTNPFSLVTCSRDKTAKVWCMTLDGTATCMTTLEGHSDCVNSVAFHPFSPIMLTSSDDNTVVIWQMSPDGTSATCVATLKGHSCFVKSVSFDPTGYLILTGSWDKTSKIWN